MKSRYSTVFIKIPCYEIMDDRLEPPLGLLYLATWLNQHGHEAHVLDLSSVQPQLWGQSIPQADIYGFSTYTTSFHRTLEILNIVKNINPGAVTVAWGPHASAFPESVSRYFDFVIVDEGEQAMLHLVTALEANRMLPPILYGNTLLIMMIIAVIAPMSFLQKVDQQIVSTAILSVLFLLAFNLLISRETNNRLQKTTEGILARMEKPPVEEVLLAYNKWMDEIEASLASAKDVWVLSRTCVSFWEEYAPQLKGVLERKGSVRLMLVDPSNGALRMIANSAKFMRARDLNSSQFSKVTTNGRSNPLFVLRARVDEFIEYITNYGLQIRRGHLNLRTIDYLPPHTLVIINGNYENGMMFVELGTFQANGRNRPTFSLHKTRNRELFSLYQNEYEVMWESAKSKVQDNNKEVPLKRKANSPL